MILGASAQGVQNLLHGLATKQWHLYLTVLLTSTLRALPQVALKTPTMLAATSIGMQPLRSTDRASHGCHVYSRPPLKRLLGGG